MSSADDVVELSLRYSDCIARAEKAEAEAKRLHDAAEDVELCSCVINDKPGWSMVPTARLDELRAALVTTSASPKEGT